MNKIKRHEFVLHETKKHSLIRFIGVMTILILYLVIMSMRFGTEIGSLVTILTWAFFVFCTPVADAGFLLAFPIRLLTGLRMSYTQIGVFILAGIIVLFALILNPSVFNDTVLLKLFYQIITNPFPYWGIVFLSFVGTLLSIYFGDELIDVSSHKQREKYHKHVNKYQVVIFLFLIGITIVLYEFLLTGLGVSITL